MRLPLLSQLRGYSRDDAQADLVAGVTVAVMLIPQGMAYAMLAGLPPVVGLYASAFPPLIYALFGTSRQLAVGPVAMDSILVAVAVGAIAQSGSQEYLQAALTLALLVGAVQLLMGVLRLGFLVNFLSQPVVRGFTSAAAIIIALSQFKHFFGIQVQSSPRLHELLLALGSALAAPSVLSNSWPTLLIAIAAVSTLILLKAKNRRIPGALIVVTLGVLVVFGLGLNEVGVAVVGSVPAGLPAPKLSLPSWQLVVQLLPAAFTIALVAFMEAIGVAKAFAARHRYDVDSNRELIALGLANGVGFLFGGYPVTGGLSRSAVNEQSGARTNLAGLWTGVFVAAAVMFLTPLFYYLPKAVLASIVVVAVLGLVDYRAPFKLWSIKRQDSLLFLLTFVSTLFIGIQQGIIIGVVTSLVVFIHRTTQPHTAELGVLPGTRVYRNLRNFPEARAIDGILILRIDASFYFANVAFLKDRIDRLLRECPAGSKAVLIDASSINDLDSSADEALAAITQRLRAAGMDLYLANVKGPVRRVMRASGLWELIGPDNIYLELSIAVDCIQERLKDRTNDGRPSAVPQSRSSSDGCDHTHVEHEQGVQTPPILSARISVSESLG